jgi:hypothetical protein
MQMSIPALPKIEICGFGRHCLLSLFGATKFEVRNLFIDILFLLTSRTVGRMKKM